MVQDLILPPKAREKIVLPSYVKLDMAFDGADSAKLYDKSRYRSHGTISGADWVTGLHGKALDFVKANGDFVEIPAAYTQLDFTSEDFSIIIRIKLRSTGTPQALLQRGRWQSDGYIFEVSAAVELRLFTNQSGFAQFSASDAASFVSGTNYTIGMSRSGSSVALYRNGIDITTTSGNHTNPKTSARKARIGIEDGEVLYPLDGEIEFLRVIEGIALPASTHLAYHNALA